MNWFSADAVAGIGIAQRLDRFVVLPAKSFGITMTTFWDKIWAQESTGALRRGKSTAPRSPSV